MFTKEERKRKKKENTIAEKRQTSVNWSYP
jgi:hypothetical protein